MSDYVYLHRGDLESARLARDHADRLRRSVTELRPLAHAFALYDGRAYDPNGAIPTLRSVLDSWIAEHETTARDLDRLAISYQDNAAIHAAPAREPEPLPIEPAKGFSLVDLLHTVLLTLGIAAAVVLSAHVIRVARQHVFGSNDPVQAGVVR